MGDDVRPGLPEYGPAHDPWSLRCAAALLSGLVHRQNQGGYRVTDFHLSALSGSIDVSVTFDGQAATRPPVMDVLFALNIADLRRMFSDPEQAARAYIHDLHLIPLAALSQAPAETTVVRIV